MGSGLRSCGEHGERTSDTSHAANVGSAMSDIVEVQDSSMPAGIEYMGVGGSTVECVEAVEMVLQSGRKFEKAILLTQTCGGPSSHAIIFRGIYGDEIAIKSGFSSGYAGTGPSGLSKAIALISWCDIDLDEVSVDERVMKRIDESSLSIQDLATIHEARRVRPKRLWDYVNDRDSEGWPDRNPWATSRVQIPFAIIDQRLLPFARDFWSDPDGSLLKAHRNLESIVANRGAVSNDDRSKGTTKVYAAAFNGDDAPLTWSGLSQSEIIGRSNLFIGTASAYRKPRAHRECNGNHHELILEFLLLNQLYWLESLAVSSK